MALPCLPTLRGLDLFDPGAGYPCREVRTLRVPVLTIHGTKDRNAPYGGGRQWSMLLPESRLVSVPGAAHMSWIEAPELVFSSIDTFLKGEWPAFSQKVNAL